MGEFGVYKQVVSIEQVKEVLIDDGVNTQRKRKLNMVVTVFIVIGMGLYSHLSIGKVLNQLVKGLRYIWNDPNYSVAKDNAISYRRKQLGARPMVKLFQRICRPIATEETPGAYLFGLRTMAIDGTKEDLADTPENAALFRSSQLRKRRRRLSPNARCLLGRMRYSCHCRCRFLASIHQ